MKFMSTKTKVFIYFFLLYFIVVPKPAYAYLDPGTGSYIFQLVIATVLGGSLFFKSGVRKFKDIFKRKSSGKIMTENEDGQ